MISNLEATDEKLKSNPESKASYVESTFISHQLPKRRPKCFICGKTNHKIGNSFYNPKSKQYKAKCRRTPEITRNLKK